MVVRATNAGTSAVITRKRGKSEIMTIPEIIERYRKFMRGIDMFDQNMTYYSYPHRAIKWWKNFFFIFLR
ncbi:unnamed protein product [Blepharisma stoltei]|uniref:PiggyBac transposable element-derived protein domain-containing protein n=1 Tax=Blepharisma stoltei TaxID=1481888 RepID=A0AAU9JD15_9CILI|nr:unnamed protein product [Blepharisma stoltei]